MRSKLRGLTDAVWMAVHIALAAASRVAVVRSAALRPGDPRRAAAESDDPAARAPGDPRRIRTSSCHRAYSGRSSKAYRLERTPPGGQEPRPRCPARVAGSR